MTSRRPNLIYIVADDLGFADLGCYGGRDARFGPVSPVLDRLAAQGLRFTEGYSNSPVCSPTRSCLMTGRYVSHTGVYTIVRPHAKWGLPLDERTLANALKDAGYTTAITGTTISPRIAAIIYLQVVMPLRPATPITDIRLAHGDLVLDGDLRHPAEFAGAHRALHVIEFHVDPFGKADAWSELSERREF
jgi:hypothetical protein